MAQFIKLNMFRDQHSGHGKKNLGNAAAMPAPRIPFLQWKVGYIVEGTSEEWKIAQIKSADGALHHEDCSVVLVNKADEVRDIKASTLRSSYKFVSTGDQPQPVPESTGLMDRDDVQLLIMNIEGMRECHPRSSGEGSRILMMDKTAYIVADTAVEIAVKIDKVGGFSEAIVTAGKG